MVCELLRLFVSSLDALGCKEVFVRVQQFNSHFEHAHGELMNKRLSVDALAPLANLAPPRRLRLPPALPNHLSRVELLIAPVSIPPRRPSQTSAPQGISRKWSRLTVQDDVESDDEPITFTDLTSFQYSISEPEIVDVEVRSTLPVDEHSLLSRSQPVVYPPVRSTSPEQSILYPAFADMVDKMVTTGVLTGHKGAGKT